MSESIKNRLKELGVHIPAVLLPSRDIDTAKWAVVACDQYTSQPEYWEKVEGLAKSCPSTLCLTYPEVYLQEKDPDERIKSINSNMKKYLEEGTLVEQKPGFIYVERRTGRSGLRRGLILAIDLESYDYTKGSQTLIRATEGTVLDRLPPRIRIRKDAPIELPHIMLLIDDPGRTVIEPLAAKAKSLETLYNFDLMMNGGHLTGYKVDQDSDIDGVASALAALAEPGAFKKKYGLTDDRGVLLFAVGDGNHSLATAKACWDMLKKDLKPEEINDHPSRYALVEVVNVHDEGLNFEPIHRVLFNVNADNLLSDLRVYFGNGNVTSTLIEAGHNAMEEMAKLKCSEGGHVIGFTCAGDKGLIRVVNPSSNIEAGTLQGFLDDYLRRNPEVKVDYVHGDEVVDRLGSVHGNMGFYLPPMDKNDLFKTVILDGVLPRKTFSMGEANEKRYYMECRRIR